MRINRRVFLSSLPKTERRQLIICRTKTQRLKLINELTRKRTRVIPALPGTTLLGGSGARVGVLVNHPEVAEDSSVSPPDIIKAASRACHDIQTERRADVHAVSLNRSYLLNGVRNAYLPSTLRIIGAVQAFVEPKPSSDFWEKAKNSEKTLQDHVRRLLETAAAYFKSTKFTDILYTMNHIVRATATFGSDIKGAMDAHHITFDTLSKELEGILMAVVNELENFPPPDKAPGHAERAEMVDKVLDVTAQALTLLAARYGIEEKVVTAYLLALKPQVQALTVAVGDINEQYPQLLPVLRFSVAVLLLPQSWILRPFLSLFGFGPAGPVKGSAAAWLQRRFWGAAVEANSWFSLLREAGKGVLPMWAWLVAKSPLLTRVALAVLVHYFNSK